MSYVPNSGGDGSSPSGDGYTGAGTGGSSSLGDLASAVLGGIGSFFGSGANAQTPNTPTNNQATTPSIDPTLAAAASINPPASLSSPNVTGIGGTLSDPTTGGGQTQQQTQPQQQDQQYAPVSAVNSLKKALQQLAGQQRNPYQPQPSQPQPLRQAAMVNTDPSFPLPNLTPGETGAPSLIPTFPNDPNLTLGGALNNRAIAAGEPQTNVEGDPVTAAGTPAAQTPLPPPRPQDVVGDPAEARIPPSAASAPSTVGGAPTPTTDDQGHQITVHKPAAAAQPQPQPSEDGGDQPPPDLPTHTGPPTKKGGPVAGPPQIPPQFIGGGPTGLNQLAQLALGLMPILAMAAASGAFGGGRRGRGGFRPFFHPGGRGHWPYHHPMQGWQFHDYHPGYPWRPMNPTHMRLFGVRDYGQGGQPDASQILQAIFGNTQQGQANQQGAGGGQGNYPPGMYRDGGEGGTGGDYVKSGNQFTDALTGLESPQGNVVSQSDKDSQGLTLAQGGNPQEISQGYFQIQNYRRGGTWGRYAGLAGVAANSPMEASYEDQHKVARLIPIREWGHRTKAQLHQRFGSFPESWTLGQLEDYFGQGKVAGTVTGNRQANLPSGVNMIPGG